MTSRPKRSTGRKGSIALAHPIITSACETKRRLRLGWTVEVLFSLMSSDRPQPRPKTIQAHVVQFCVFVHRICLGSLLRIVGRLAGLFASIAPERITTRIASRWVLDKG